MLRGLLVWANNVVLPRSSERLAVGSLFKYCRYSVPCFLSAFDIYLFGILLVEFALLLLSLWFTGGFAASVSWSLTFQALIATTSPKVYICITAFLPSQTPTN